MIKLKNNNRYGKEKTTLKGKMKLELYYTEKVI